MIFILSLSSRGEEIIFFYSFNKWPDQLESAATTPGVDKWGPNFVPPRTILGCACQVLDLREEAVVLSTIFDIFSLPHPLENVCQGHSFWLNPSFI